MIDKATFAQNISEKVNKNLINACFKNKAKMFEWIKRMH